MQVDYSENEYKPSIPKSENYKNLLFPKQENHYQFLFPIRKIGKANGHPDEKVPSHYLGNEFGDSPSQFSHEHGEGIEVLSIDIQVMLLQHPPLASWQSPHCINCDVIKAF